MPLLPGMKIGAHVDVFKDTPDGGRVLVKTTRPCPDCGQPLDESRLVVPRGSAQAHAVCPPEGTHA